MLLSAMSRVVTSSDPLQRFDLVLHAFVCLAPNVLGEKSVEHLDTEIPLSQVGDSFLLKKPCQGRETQVRLGRMPGRRKQQQSFQFGTKNVITDNERGYIAQSLDSSPEEEVQPSVITAFYTPDELKCKETAGRSWFCRPMP
jgi:hypothetical protein